MVPKIETAVVNGRHVKIAHLADIHIRSLSRHDEFREVFVALSSKLRVMGVDHIMLGGDLFHTKVSGISPEFIELLSWWLTDLSTIGCVHIILGNHDGLLNNLTRQDAISPIVSALNNPNIKLYKQSGVYQFAPGYNWCVFSIFDEEGWTKVKPVPGDVNIALFHGPVWGALTESDWRIESDMTSDFFKDYDFCFLGDIHKFQFLDYRSHVIEIDESDLHLYPDAEVVEE